MVGFSHITIFTVVPDCRLVFFVFVRVPIINHEKNNVNVFLCLVYLIFNILNCIGLDLKNYLVLYDGESNNGTFSLLS